MEQAQDEEKILRQLSRYKKYNHLSSYAIAKQLHFDVNNYETELKRLKGDEERAKELTTNLKQYNIYRTLTEEKVRQDLDYYQSRLNNLQSEFSYFQELPDELQAKILSSDRKVLKRSPRISHAIRKSPSISYAYYNKYCHLPLQYDETTSYLKQKEHQIVKLYYDDHTIQRFHLSYRESSVHYSATDYKLKTEGPIKISLYQSVNPWVGNAIFDIYTMYQIYKQRRCEVIHPGYAKEKVKEALLSLNKSVLRTDNYKNDVLFFMYLRSSIKIIVDELQLNTIQLPKNEYLYYTVRKAHPEDVFGKNNLTVAELRLQLREQSDAMLQQLLYIIDQTL